MPKNVLLVDDSRTIRTSLLIPLKTAGYKAFDAGDGMHGMMVLEQEQIDLLIVDLNMPLMDGFQMIEMIRGRPEFLTLPIIVMTTETSNEKVIRAKELGVQAWVVKPCDPNKLLELVQRVLPN